MPGLSGMKNSTPDPRFHIHEKLAAMRKPYRVEFPVLLTHSINQVNN